MENKITIREAITERETAAFWEQLHAYHKRDMFPDPNDEDLDYFLGEEYRQQIMKLRSRPQDRAYFLFFYRDERQIGFALPVLYTSEDGKCFIMEFCVYPGFRGNGTGLACAAALLEWAAGQGALYAELNCSGDAQRRFWNRVGFVENGVDEWGEPLMLLPPTERVPITVEVLTDPEDWQLKKLENGFLQEIGEAPATEQAQARLSQAIREGKITFFVAKRGCRAVGMCSVARCFSTFACTDNGVLEDFYIEPAFRKQGAARKLVHAAQEWSKQNGLVSLTVTCAPCDVELYQAMGFACRLGHTSACIL